MGGADCELLGDGWLAQPVNAWSSLAYLVVAVWVVRRRRDRVAVTGAVALAFVAVGSVAYHGPQPGWGEAVHDASIAALLAAVLVAVVAGRRVVDRLAVAALFLGAAFYVLGHTDGPLCSPSSLVQLHAAWHAASAVAAGAVLGGPRPAARPPLDRR